VVSSSQFCDNGGGEGTLIIIVRYLSVSLSLTLCKNEKVERHIKKKTCKLNVLRFWVEGSVRYLSVSLSLTLGKNDKVEQHIRKKTCKPNASRFWVKGDIIPLCDLTQFSLYQCGGGTLT